MSEGRRLAVVFPLALEPVHLDKDVGLIPDGLRGRGWDAEIHCAAARGTDWRMPVRAAGREALADPAYWADQRVDAAIAITFARHGDIAAALRAAGVRVVGKGDTDGLVSPRIEPRATLRETVWHRGGPVWRARSLASWLARLGPRHGAQVHAVEAAVGNSDAFVVETEPARRRLARLLERYGDARLARRLRTVLNPVAPVFTRGEVAGERQPLVVAVGRWDDPQKNPRAMRRALERFLTAHPGYRAHVVGAAAERRFRGLGRVEVSPHLEPRELAGLVGRARIVASSSRFESFALAAHEGLASGSSVAGPPLAPFLQIAELGRFGTVAQNGGAAGLAAALAREARAWDAGERGPAAIAEFWRRLLDVDAVAERYERLLRDGRASTSS